jgi:hypothetical protein
MSEILPPFLVDARVLKNAHVMVRSWIAIIYVNKQTFVLFIALSFFAAIKPSPMTWIPPRFPDHN